jgi:hypothetical protein
VGLTLQPAGQVGLVLDALVVVKAWRHGHSTLNERPTADVDVDDDEVDRVVFDRVVDVDVVVVVDSSAVDTVLAISPMVIMSVAVPLPSVVSPRRPTDT